MSESASDGPAPPPGGGWRRWAGLVALTFAAGWAGWSVAAQRTQIAAALAHLSPGVLVGSLVASGAGVLLTAWSWRQWLTTLDVELPVPAAARVFLLTQVGKYVPGSVWPFLAQAAAGRAYGVPATTFPAATVLFLYSHVVTALVVGGGCLLLTGGPFWLAAPLLLAAVGFWPAVPRLLLRPLRRLRPGLTLIPGTGSASGHLLLVAAWWCYGLALWVLVGALTPEPVPLLRVTGVFAVAWVVGLLVVIAPAGVGPREAVLLALLEAPLGHSGALTIALVSRVVMTVADVGLAVLAALVPPGRADNVAGDG